MQSLDKEISISIYQASDKEAWDSFIDSAINPHFFFKRDFMEYHSDRFTDFSLMFYNKKGNLIALLPANVKDGELFSHQGLTMGGFIVDASMRSPLMLAIFEELKSFCVEQRINKLIYKAMPHIYHLKPAQFDLYALTVNDAQLVRRDLSSTIDLTKEIKFQERRRRMIKKAKEANLSLAESQDYTSFWQILGRNLNEKYATDPVHSLEEIDKLAASFPDNIKLYSSSLDGALLAGVLVFENQEIVHTQYLAASEKGKELGALDLLLDHLINKVFKETKRYFDFGISTEQAGTYLNQGLIEQKEGFGASAVTYDFYELATVHKAQ